MHGSTTLSRLTRFAVAGLLAVPATMSDPVGVYAVIDKVVLSPDATNPTTIQIWGTFAVSEQTPGDKYLTAAKGYLYYSIGSGKERATRAEWADLQSLAGKKTLVGFGAKWQTKDIDRVRCATEAPSSPDVYRIGAGVTKLPMERNSAWKMADGMLKGTAPDAPCTKSK